jgi:predicted house-cleaning NTP pyrophosphatase (Maf/HAM1 superfamily)
MLQKLSDRKKTQVSSSQNLTQQNNNYIAQQNMTNNNFSGLTKENIESSEDHYVK